MERSAVPREILHHCAAGLLAAALFAVLLLLADAGGLRGLLAASPQFAAAFMAGAFVSFLPLVICIAVGSVRRGLQESGRMRRDDVPVK